MSQRKQRTLTSSDAEQFSKETTSHHEDIASSTQHTESLDEELALHYTKYPNRWSRIRYVPTASARHLDSSVSRIFGTPSEYIREPAAEFFGVMILIIFGAGVDCQVVLSANTNVASTPKGVSAHHISSIVVY